jgi:NAD(P)-dependent dehydrogenase (short-subunit alcohol dehydrogenase family)
MSERLQGNAAVVMGASSGIGRAMARRFAAEGAGVTVASRHEEPRGGGVPTHERIAEDGNEAQFVETDVTATEDIENAIDETVDAYGGLDVAANNAGVFLGKPIDEVDESDYDEQMDVNLKGLYFCCQAAAEAMADDEREGGAIVNTSSIAGVVGYPGASLYSAAKGGVTNLTRELAAEKGPEGIRVNAIAPGIIETEMAAEDAGVTGAMTDRIPLGRDGDPEDIADAAAFLASDQAAYINGHNLVVDGGLTAGL